MTKYKKVFSNNGVTYFNLQLSYVTMLSHIQDLECDLKEVILSEFCGY